MLKVHSRFLLAGVVLVLAACASKPIRVSDYSEGHWRAKALIKDKEQSRSYIVNLNFNLIRDDRMRMDVTSALGTGVASLLVDQKGVRYVLYDSKRFYYGAPQAHVMRPILALPFDPRWIQNLLLDLPFQDKSWTCRVDESHWVQSCEDKTNGLKVTWSSRQGEKKTILLEHAKATVQINVQSFKPKVESRENIFVLEPPEGFQQLRVR